RRGIENLSTPAEAAGVMCLLANGEFISTDVSEEVLAFLRKVKSTSVRNGVPSEVPVATKPGGIPHVATEWAIVELPTQSYIIVLMGKDGDTDEFRKSFTEITKLVHQFMAG